MPAFTTAHLRAELLAIVAVEAELRELAAANRIGTNQARRIHALGEELLPAFRRVLEAIEGLEGRDAHHVRATLRELRGRAVELGRVAYAVAMGEARSRELRALILGFSPLAQLAAPAERIELPALAPEASLEVVAPWLIPARVDALMLAALPDAELEATLARRRAETSEAIDVHTAAERQARAERRMLEAGHAVNAGEESLGEVRSRRDRAAAELERRERAREDAVTLLERELLEAARAGNVEGLLAIASALAGRPLALAGAA